MYKLYQYNDNEFRIVCTKDNNKIIFNDKEKHIIDDDEVERISLSRTKRSIREIIKCNNFEYFFTLTVNSNSCDRFSLDACQKFARKIMKSIKRKQFDFIYLFITEKHEKGGFHFHGVCSYLPTYINSNGYLSNLDFDKLGFNSFSLIRDKSKCSNYICKYITKDCVRNSCGSVYFSSKGLARPTSYDIKPLDMDFLGAWSNDYCKIFDYDITTLDYDKLKYLCYNIHDL